MAADADDPVTESPPPPIVERQRRELAELAACRRELVASVTKQVAFYVEHFGKTPREAAALAATPSPFDPAERPADQVGWWELAAILEADPEQGHALWAAVKAEAREELATGLRAARALEAQAGGRPLGRAQFGVVVEALTEALRPRDALEVLLVQQLAAAYDLHLRWQARAVQRTDLEAWHGESDRRRELERMSPAQRGRYGTTGWMPPRLSDAEAIEQAALIADRYQRGFLRLLKAFRDNRRLFGALVVAGGQVNIGEQQVNVHQEPPRRPGRGRAAPVRRTAAARIRRAGRPA